MKPINYDWSQLTPQISGRSLSCSQRGAYIDTKQICLEVGRRRRDGCNGVGGLINSEKVLD